MSIKLETQDLPEEDGADFLCSVVFYPYRENCECRKVSQHMLTDSALSQLQDVSIAYDMNVPGNHAPEFNGKLLCSTHYNLANEFMEGQVTV